MRNVSNKLTVVNTCSPTNNKLYLANRNILFPHTANDMNCSVGCILADLWDVLITLSDRGT